MSMKQLAMQVIENPAFKAAFDNLRAEYVQNMLTSDPLSPDLPTKLLKVQLLEDVMNELEAMVNG